MVGLPIQRHNANREKGRIMKSVEKRSRVGWPRIAPATFAVAAFVSASLAAALLSGTSLAQVDEEAPGFEYTSEDAPYEEGLRDETTLEETAPEGTAAEATDVEETAASEDTAAGQGISAPVEQYYAQPPKGLWRILVEPSFGWREVSCLRFSPPSPQSSA